jgi:di/tricarboxylate transporter
LGNLTNEIKNFSGKKENKNSDSLLYTSAYLGTTLFSSSFLTASLLNIIVLSILPLQEQQQFHTEGWFKATFVITAVLLIAYIFVLFIFFKNKEKKSCEFNLGLEKMGRITPNEIISLAIVLIFFFGILTTQHHHIASSWLGFSLLFLLMVLGVVSVDEFQKKVDWSYLFFLSAIIGISVTFKALKLDLWFYDNMLILFPEILEDKVLLFSLIALITILMRFMLPVGAVVAFLIPVILAIANKEGVSAWSLGMVVLFVGDIWFFPYQCFFYKYYRSIFNESYDIDEKKFLRINLVINAFKLIGLFLSFYYWKYLSLA